MTTMTSLQSTTPVLHLAGAHARNAAATSELDAARVVLSAASSRLIAFLAGPDARISGVTLDQLRNERAAARHAADIAQQRRTVAAGRTIAAADRSSLAMARAA